MRGRRPSAFGGCLIDPRVIEPIAARGWPAAETAELGGWRLYASSGHSGRINTCWALEPLERDIDEAIGLVEAWYEARGLPPKFKIVQVGDAAFDLIGRLRRRGYVSDT